MTYHLLRSAEFANVDMRVLFANTGEEDERTLQFVNRCDKEFGFNTIWIEGVQTARRKPISFRVVSFETASRKGEPYEDAIRKFGIPNTSFPHCTRHLKTRPMEAYAKSIGWSKCYKAIGIRADEMDRVSSAAQKYKVFYPLTGDPWYATKPEINRWWAAQPFRLGMKSYEGNCTWCWKKSLRKHLTLLRDRPEIYEFPRRMEQQYGLVGPEFNKVVPPTPDYRRAFFRDNRSVDDLIREGDRRNWQFKPVADDSVNYTIDHDLDLAGGCEETCEVYSDESERAA